MVTTTVAPVTPDSAAGAVVLRDGQSVMLAPQEVLRVGDRVVTTGKAADVMVPTASGAKSVLLRVAPNSEIVVRPAQANGGPATADVVVTKGDADFVDLPDDLGEPVSILKKTKSSSMLAGGDLGLADGFVGGLLPFVAGLATLAALTSNKDASASTGAAGLAGAAGTNGTGTNGTGINGTGATGAAGATGATGAAGPRGATGSIGGIGATGAVGSTGATGAMGGIGGTGSTGATGGAGAAIIDQGLLNSVGAVTAGLGVPLAAVVGSGGLLGHGGSVDQLLGGGLVGNPGLIAHLPAPGSSTTLLSGVDRTLGILTSTSALPLPAPLNGLNLAPVAALADQVTTAVDMLALGPDLNNQGLLSQAASVVTGIASTAGTLTGNAALGTALSNLAVNATNTVASVLSTDVLNSQATSTAGSLLGPNGMLDQMVATLATNLDQTLVTGGTINHLLAGRVDQITNGVNQIVAPVADVVDDLTAYLNGGMLGNATGFVVTHGADQQLVSHLVSALNAQGFVGELTAGLPVGVGTVVQGLDASHLVADSTALAQSLLSAASGGAPALLQSLTTVAGGQAPGATDPLQPVTTLVNGVTGGTDPLQSVTTLVHSLAPGPTDPLQPVTTLVGGVTAGTTDPLQFATTLAHGVTDPLQSVINLAHGLTAGPTAPVTALVDQAALLPVHTASLVSLAGTVPGASNVAPVVTQAAEALAPIQQPIVTHPAVHGLNDVVGSVLGHRLV